MSQDVYYATGSLESFVSEVGRDDTPAHFVVVGTKPDLIKQAPILKELQAQGLKAFLIHTGQHYDENLSGGIEKEFGLKVDVNLGVSGGILSTNIANIIDRFGVIVHAIKESHPQVQVIPYVHGDTTTCFATTTASFNLGFPTIHIEAGIRTYMIKMEELESFRTQESEAFNFLRWFDVSCEIGHYTKGSHEPFPEQWNTRCSEAGTGLFMAPVPLASENLENEGFPKSRIFTPGNSVVDAMDFVDTIDSDIFDQYPMLGDGFIRVCIHRRENTESEIRFKCLFEMVEELSIESEIPVLWILLPGTKKAIERFGYQDRLEKLKEKSNMVISDVWPKYSDVVAAMKRCKLCATDSGSMQEEMNMMHIPCATLRFGSDRPETLFARANVLCPPVESHFMVEILMGAYKNAHIFDFPNLYGEKVSQKIVQEVKTFLASGKPLVRLQPE